MIACFFAKFGHVATIPLEDRKMVTADWYVNHCLPKVFQAWCKRRPRTVVRGLLLHHDNASAHAAAVILDSLATNEVQLVTHLPYSLDLAPCDWFLFPSAKRPLKGKQFQNAEDARAFFEGVILEYPVIPHQDSTFLYTSPRRLMGLWIALEDATLENGCLWFIPGSHKEGLHGNKRMVRKAKPEPGTSSTEFTGTEPEYDNSRFIAGPVKKGTLVLIHGDVVHKSEHNYSDNSREIYTFHMYDHASCTYDERNWLLPTEANTFCHLFSS